MASRSTKLSQCGLHNPGLYFCRSSSYATPCPASHVGFCTSANFRGSRVVSRRHGPRSHFSRACVSGFQDREQLCKLPLSLSWELWPALHHRALHVNVCGDIAQTPYSTPPEAPAEERRSGRRGTVKICGEVPIFSQPACIKLTVLLSKSSSSVEHATRSTFSLVQAIFSQLDRHLSTASKLTTTPAA